MRVPVDLPTSVFTDTFVDANTTSLSSHTPTINTSGWTQTASNSFYIQSNTLQPNRYTDGDMAIIDTGLTEFSASITVTPAATSGQFGLFGLVFRYTDNSNYWYVLAQANITKFVVYKVQNGVSTLMLEMTYYQQGVGTNTIVRADCWGKNNIIYVNGIELTTISDSFNQLATKCGLILSCSAAPISSPSCKNFDVKPFYGTKINWPDYTEQANSIPLLDLGTSGAFDSADINNPNVAYDSVNSRWVMCYSGNDGTDVQDLGVAYATNLLGPWVKEASNPVLSSTPGDKFGINGGLVKLNNTWWYYYCTNTSTKISAASSTDLVNWTTYGVVLDIANNGAWDDTQLYDPMVRLREDGRTIEVWYTGNNNTRAQGFGYATTTDCTTFKRSNKPVISVPQYAAGTFGEPDIFIPPGQEGKQMLISFGASFTSDKNTRFIMEYLTLNGGNSWHSRINTLKGNGSGWESSQVFDANVILSNNTLYLFHSGSYTTGLTVGLQAKIGVATASFPDGKFTTA